MYYFRVKRLLAGMAMAALQLALALLPTPTSPASAGRQARVATVTIMAELLPWMKRATPTSPAVFKARA